MYYRFFDKYKGHNQVVSTLALYLGGPEFKFEPEDWLLWEAMIQYRHTGDAAILTGSAVVETWYRHTGDVATLSDSDLVQSIHTLVTACIYNIYGLFNSTVNRSHFIALFDKVINE